MTNHNNIYNILAKLKSVEPVQEVAPKKESVLKSLTEHANSSELVRSLNQRFLAEKSNKPDFLDMDKDGDKKEPMKKAVADKKKNPFAKKVSEGEVDEDMLSKKDYDGDGKKESGKDEYMGSRDKAIKKSMSGSGSGKNTMEGEYQDKVDKSKIPAFQRKAKGGDDWKVDLDDLDDEASKSPTGAAGLAKAKDRLGMKEGFPTVDDARKRSEQERGTGKFDKQTTSTGTRYTRKSDTYHDDDSAETTTSDAPKKKGRPKKNTGPERTTSKAWKHKGSRVAEHLNIATVVEETMAELDDLLVMERDMGKHNNKTTGFKALAAKTNDKIAGAQFQKMKDAGQLGEGIAYESSEPGLNAICHRYGKECKDFMTTGELDDDLFHALYDHYFDDMPYGVKKARDGDPYEWVADRFHDDMGGSSYDGGDDSLSSIPSSIKLDLGKDKELDELARLAGVGKDVVGESGCNMTAEGEYCPEHGLAECGSMMWEGKGEKPDYIDIDKDGDKKEPMKKAAKEKDELDESLVDECGDMGPMANGMTGEQDSGMSVSTSVDTRTGRKTININADGETAEQIAQILKMAGLAAHGQVYGDDHQGHMHMHAEQPQMVAVAEEYANTPNVDYEDIDAIIDQGGDLNKKKKQDPKTANKAANPLKEADNEVVDRLKAMYSRFKQH